MNAHECYELLVGEIGIDHNLFMYGLKQWQVIAIIKGYRKRQRPLWEAARLNAYFTMTSMADLRKANINSDRDLIKFPWEQEANTQNLPSEAEVEEMRQMLQSMNERCKE